MDRLYNLNEDYFSDLKTHEQAYVLGFIYADGYNREDCLELDQNGERLDILEKIKILLESDAPIKSYLPNAYKIQFSSVKLCKDLTKLGAIKNKSLTLQFPTFIPDELMGSFILGYFDGDGCVWNGKRKKMTVKDEKHPGQYRERIVHNVKFTFTGNFDFINELQNYLIKRLGFKKTKLNFSKAKNENTSTSKNVCTMEYSGRGQMKKLYELMYEHSSVWCNEKRKKFEEIFCALDEKSSKDTELIAGTPETVISSQASFIDIKDEGSTTIPEMEVESSDSKYSAPNVNYEGEDIVCSNIK